MKYVEYLKSPRWKKKRERSLAFAERRCQICGSRKHLEVHHNTYENLGHEKLRDLIVLCDDCHELYRSKMVEPVDDLKTLQNVDSWPAVRMEDGTIRQGKDAKVIGRWK
jgi:5-methylcytosine-specific restriction endonuclease McrA